MSREEMYQVRNVLSDDRYAIYLRKSRADLELEAKGQGETLERHRRDLMELAEQHGIAPNQITVYQEIVSGESLQDRPEALKLLADVSAQKYKGVLVMEVERLARGNTRDQGEVAEAFYYSSTFIITPMKIYNPEDESDEEYFEFGLFMARREYKTIRRRLVRGKNRSAAEGNYLPPQSIFGYDIVRTSKKDRYLVINEDAKYVRMIFDWFTEEGKGTGWIARQLTHMGLQPAKKGREWSKRTVQCMLKNKHYIGLIVWGEYKTVKRHDPETGKLVKSRVKADPSEVIVAKGKHEAIISDEQFEAAQAILGVKHAPPATKEISNPLASILHCAKCGKSMYRFDAKDRRTIRYAHRSSAVCTVKSLPVDQVLGAVVDALNGYIADFDLKAQADSNKAAVEQHKELLAIMEKELERLEKRRERLFDSYEDGAYTKAEFIERKQKYNASIEELKERIRDEKDNPPEQVDYAEKISALRLMIKSINNPSLSAGEKNKYLREYIADIKYDSIDYGPGKGGLPVLDVILR